MSGAVVTLSTVTPVYHGAKHLRALVEALDEVRQQLETADSPLRLAEAVFADDASVDDSAEVLAALADEYPWVRVVTLSRNFGQHPATAAGILHTSGDWIATLDEDLQHHPRHLVDLVLRAAHAGHDIVYAKPASGPHESWFRDYSSTTFKAFVSWLSRNPNIPKFNSFRMLRAPVARAAAAVMSQETYFDIALCWFTTRIDAVTLEMKDLRYIEGGQSSYRLRSLLSHAQRMVTSSRMRLLRVASGIGFFALLLAVGLGASYIGARLLGVGELEQYRGWTSLFVSITFFGGLTAALLGVVLEHMSIASLQSQGRPTFFVVDRSGDALLKDMRPGALD